jgi:hypothetical protein
MKYACLIYSDYSDPDANPNPASPEFAPIMDGYFKFTADVQAAGVYVGGEALESVESATSVQVRDGDVVTTDGPFAETKEQLGGFYILECETLDEAISWAAKIPHAANGTVEVRPVPSFDQPG